MTSDLCKLTFFGPSLWTVKDLITRRDSDCPPVPDSDKNDNSDSDVSSSDDDSDTDSSDMDDELDLLCGVYNPELIAQILQSDTDDEEFEGF